MFHVVPCTNGHASGSGPVTDDSAMSVQSNRMRAMSDHYELVFSTFLHDDTPASVLAALRWHMGMDDNVKNPEGLDPDDIRTRCSSRARADSRRRHRVPAPFGTGVHIIGDAVRMGTLRAHLLGR